MRPVPGFDGYYVTTEGRIWSTRKWRGERGRWLRGGVHGRAGHLSVILSGRHFLVHAIVMLTFVGPYPKGLEIRHLNGDPTDNRLSNLKYGTPAENRQDTIRHGRDYWASRTHCANGHEYTEENTYVPQVGPNRRVCRTCRAEGWKRQNKRRRAG